MKNQISHIVLGAIVLTSLIGVNLSGDDKKITNPQIDFNGFLDLSTRLKEVRDEQLVTVTEFLQMADEPNTMILDTRSKDAFDKLHIDGAVHLNFSDFTTDKLSKVIPDKNTRILIYCNNNFTGEKKKLEAAAMVSKGLPLALNIPTFINLHGYGYENVYELADLVNLSKSGIPLVGKAALNAE